jgi:hypothetical protein
MMFDANLSEAVRGRALGMIYLSKPRFGTVLMPHDGAQWWTFATAYFPDRGEELADFDEARSAALIREAIGLADRRSSWWPDPGHRPEGAVVRHRR